MNTEQLKSISLEEAKKLTLGTTIHHRHFKNSNGSPERWRVNGKVKTWKRDPNRIQVPIKYGLYGYGYLTEDNLNDFSLGD